MGELGQWLSSLFVFFVVLFPWATFFIVLMTALLWPKKKRRRRGLPELRITIKEPEHRVISWGERK